MNTVYYFRNPLNADEKMIEKIFEYMPYERQQKYSRGIKAYRYEGIICFGLLMYARSMTGEDYQNIVFTYSDKGKPFVNGMNFNFSHCEECCACAVGSGSIGVDVQRKDKVSDSVINRYCTEKEKKKLVNGMPFKRLWTQKEAIVKCTGKGIEGLLELSDLSYYENDKTSYITPYGCIYTDIIGDCAVSVCSHDKETKLFEVTQQQLDRLLTK